jgi:carboxyl-terminal processing protease
LSVLAGLSASPGETSSYRGGDLFEKVVRTLAAHYYDQRFREQDLPKLAETFREQACEAKSLAEERKVVHALLSRIPASHLGLLSRRGRDLLVDELFGRRAPTVGMQLLGKDGGYFASMILEGGPAERAGVKSWDRVLRIDGTPVEGSTRLDWRIDDAHLDDERDPPIHLLLVEAGETLTLTLERRPGEIREVKLQAVEDSSFEAAKRSVRVIECEGRHLGYIHFWLLHMTGVPELLREALLGHFKECDALLLDLRGRGGNAPVVAQVMRLLNGPEAVWTRPVVALVDRQSRSGKDALAYELKVSGRALLVGEPTAGAVLPAAFADVGPETVLMFPSFSLPRYTELLELKPTAPDVHVERAGPYSAGLDPILDAGIREALELTRGLEPAPLAMPVQSSPPVAFDPAAFPLPTMEALLDEMVLALGGGEALRARSHLIARGTIAIVDTPVEGTFELKLKAPMRLVSRASLGPVGIVETEFDGHDAWQTSPSTPRSKLSGEQALAVRLRALFYGPLQYREAFEEILVESLELFDQRPCFRLSLRDASGSALTVFVDARTKLLAGMSGMMQSPLGEIPVKTYFREYRPFEGVPRPTQYVLDAGFQRQRITLTDVQLD